MDEHKTVPGGMFGVLVVMPGQPLDNRPVVADGL
jgi:hypothetical protein